MSEAIQLSQLETFIENWHECYLSQYKKTGYVMTLDLSDEERIQIWYGLNDLEYLLRSASLSLKDVYISLNAFVHGSRKTSDLRQIRNIGVDLDFYKLGLTREHVMAELNRLIAKGTIPCPNLMLHGRGMQLIYSISGGAAPGMGFMAQYITNNLIKSLMHVGADGACSDLSRVFRLPHSIHSKTGKQIEVDIWTKREYQLMELYEYVPPMEKKRPTRRKGTIETLPAPKGVMTLYSLNTARKVDLEKIVELRRGDIEHRNDMTYIYAFTTALIVKQQNATVEMAIQLNDRFRDPQPHKEVRRTATRAYKDAITFFDALADSKFKMDKLPKGLIKPMKNVTVLEKLNVTLTQEEKEHMSTLLDKEENQRRDTVRKRVKRREQGVESREDYLKQKENTLAQLKKIMETTAKPKWKSIAQELNISERHLRRLRKEL